MAMSNFENGQTVRSLVDAQGLCKGSLYTVTEVRKRSTFAGTFVTLLVVAADGTVKVVGNPGLVLEEVR